MGTDHGHSGSESGDELASSFFRKAHLILGEKESLALTEEQTQTIRGLKLDAVAVQKLVDQKKEGNIRESGCRRHSRLRRLSRLKQ